MKKRWQRPDTWRGLALISMIFYHAVWDAVYLYGVECPWFFGAAAWVWQQSICWLFIWTAGFSFSLSRAPLRRGMMTFLAGAAVSAVTFLFSPTTPIFFGVLTLIGSSALLTVVLHPLLRRIPAEPGALGAAWCFAATYAVPQGRIGWCGLGINLPDDWYRGFDTAYLGMPGADFVSADYFPLLPWFFLYLCGYFCYRRHTEVKAISLVDRGMKLPAFLGRHSLALYFVHQPVLLAGFALIFR